MSFGASTFFEYPLSIELIIANPICVVVTTEFGEIAFTILIPIKTVKNRSGKNCFMYEICKIKKTILSETYFKRNGSI